MSHETIEKCSTFNGNLEGSKEQDEINESN